MNNYLVSIKDEKYKFDNDKRVSGFIGDDINDILIFWFCLARFHGVIEYFCISAYNAFIDVCSH